MLRPTRDLVLVQKEEEKERITTGGIYMPDQSQGPETNIKGTVRRTGPGKHSPKGKLIPMTVQEGDEVVFGKFSGSGVDVDGVPHILLPEDDILGILK